MMDAILENRRLSRWATRLARGPEQLGAIHESDAELLPLGDNRMLALTVDQVLEEVTSGLYRQPATVGRIAATASLSDLAAVGADVLGLLFSVTLPPTNQDIIQDGVADGICDVTARAHTHVLGGDTSEGPSLSIACTAVGIVPGQRVLTRLGAAPGDTIYATGLLGLGAAFAAVRLLDLPESLVSEEAFSPPLRLREGQALRGLASCCMDTSDGLLATLDQLSRLNQVAMTIDEDPDTLLHPKAEQVRAALGLLATPLLAAIHGEFELVFTVAANRRTCFEENWHAQGFTVKRIGVVAAGEGVHVRDRRLDTARIRNLGSEAVHNPRQYLQQIVELCA